MNNEKLFFEMKSNIKNGRIIGFNINLVEEDFSYDDIDEDGFINIDHKYFDNGYKCIVYGLEGVVTCWLESGFDRGDDDRGIKEEFIRTVEKYKDRCETWDEVEEECYIKTFFTGWD